MADAPDWDANSPEVAKNLGAVLIDAQRVMQARRPLDADMIRRWHIRAMQDLSVPDAAWVGAYRHELTRPPRDVVVGSLPGVLAIGLSDALDDFFTRLGPAVAALDQQIQPSGPTTEDEVDAIVTLAAFAHAEWVRLHPFMNGNGRTARCIANALAMRYGLPPFVRLRPRPDDGYGQAAGAAMLGDWQATIPVLRRALDRMLDET